MKTLNLVITCIAFTLTTLPSLAKSQKKLAADEAAIHWTAPQVLESRDNLVGVRTGLGELNDGGSGVGLHLERQVSSFISLNGEAYFSNYSQNINNFGNFKYESTILVFYGSFHADILKIKNLDTYLSLGVAHSLISASWSSPLGLPNPGSAKADSTDFIAFLTGRYFFNSQWAGSVSIGKNLNTMIIGADYLF